MKILTNILKQVYSCFFWFRELLNKNIEKLLVATMLINSVCFIVMCIYFYHPYFKNPKTFIEPDWFNTFYMQTIKFANGGFFFLLFVTAKSKGFKFLARFALSCMWVMWFVNEYYLLTDDIRSPYFIYFCLTVFVSFMVTALFKLTNRC